MNLMLRAVKLTRQTRRNDSCRRFINDMEYIRWENFSTYIYKKKHELRSNFQIRNGNGDLSGYRLQPSTDYTNTKIRHVVQREIVSLSEFPQKGQRDMFLFFFSNANICRFEHRLLYYTAVIIVHEPYISQIE